MMKHEFFVQCFNQDELLQRVSQKLDVLISPGLPETSSGQASRPL